MSDENCHVEPTIKPVDEEALAQSMTAVLAVDGMGCPRCAIRVRNGLLRVEGVVVADVVLDQGIAGVAYDPTRLAPADLVDAVANSGDGSHHVYSARFIQNVPSAQVWQIKA